MRRWFLVTTLLTAAVGTCLAQPPALHMGQSHLASYSQAYGRIVCYADALVRPNTTAELAAAIQQLRASAAAAGKQMKLRASRNRFHGLSTFGCPGAFGPGYGSAVPFTQPLGPPTKSSASPSTAAVLNDDMVKVLSVDRSKLQVTVQAGLRIDRLLHWADANGFSIERGAPTTYAELSIAGVLATGSHSTGFNVTSNLAGVTLNITWVDASGAVHTSPRHSPEGRALCGGLGLLGIMTEVSLQLTAPSLTMAVSRTFLEDKDLAADINGYLKESPWTAVVWRPDIGRYSAFTLHAVADDRAGASLDLGGSNVLIPRMPRALYAVIEMFYYPWQGDYRDALLGKLLNPLNCAMQNMLVALQTWGGVLGTIPQPVAIGSTNRMAGGGCDGGCAWEGDLAADDIAFAIEMDDLPGWLDDVRAITKIDLQEGGGAPERCMSTGHYLLRFGQGSHDFTSPWAGLRQPAVVELSLLRDRRHADQQAKFAWVADTVEQLTLCKYRGRPHWGKNWDRTFTHKECPVAGMLPGLGKLLELQRKHDPSKVFEPPLATAIISGSQPPRAPRCALSKQCYCERDADCGEGHACVASAAFPEYLGCRPKGLQLLLG